MLNDENDEVRIKSIQSLSKIFDINIYLDQEKEFLMLSEEEIGSLFFNLREKV